MESWWQDLSRLNQAFVLLAVFFSALFLWQFLGALIGISGDHDISAAPVTHDVPAGGVGHGDGDAVSGTMVAFKLMSIRSVIAFGTLFSWSGTLYLMDGTPVAKAMTYSVLWGVAAMVLVAYSFYKLAALQEIGNASLRTAIGQSATVYADIPQNGAGKVRVLVSGAVTCVSARAKDGLPLMAGTEVKVLGIIGPNILEVEKAKKTEGV